MNISSLKDTLSFGKYFNKKKVPDEATPYNEVGTVKDIPYDKKEFPKDTIYIDAKNIWITNDGMLRDEGVLFGLTSAITDEKIAAIKNYYTDLRAGTEAKKGSASNLLNSLLNERKGLELELEKLPNENKGEADQELKSPDTHFFRNLLGLVLICGAAIGNFFLIHYFVTPAFGLAVSIGVFLFGLFSLIAPLSTWLNPDEQISGTFLGKLKMMLLEIGSPIATTVFVSYLIYSDTQKMTLTIVTALFLLFLFFFCGKLLLGVYYKVVLDFKQIKNHKKLLGVIKEKDKIKSDVLSKNAIALEELTKRIQDIQAEVLKLEAECLSYDQQSELKINLFMSEYNLAKNYSAKHNI